MERKKTRIVIDVPEKISRKASTVRSVKFKEILNPNEEKKEDNTKNENEEIENQKLRATLFASQKTCEILDNFILNDDRRFYDQEDFGRTTYVSQDSHEEFFTKYKSFGEIVRKGLVKTSTPSFAFIKACNETMIVPNPMGLIKKKGDLNEVNLKNEKFGDNYVKALSSSMRFSDHIKEINLSANRLTFNSVNPLLNSVRENKKLLNKLQLLDLSYNIIGEQSIQKLVEYIKDEECNLREFSLEGNSLGDKLIKKISDAISKYLFLKINFINLSKNLISDECAICIANIIENCINLQILVISWNHIKNKGATLIFHQLKKHNEMKVFDISWNSIGDDLIQEPTFEEIKINSQETRERFHNFELNEFKKSKYIKFRNNLKKDKNDKTADNKKKQDTKLKPIIIPNKAVSDFAKELGEYFKETSIELVHLDISHNNICYEDAEYISKEVKNNHSILGLHVDGNQMRIDPLGFIHPIKKEHKNREYFANSQIYYNISKENNLIRSNIDKVRKIRAKNNCWICEGWREVNIKYIDIHNHINPDNFTYVKLHLNFDEWNFYDVITCGDSFFNIRMCPPGEVHYFFSVNKRPIEDYGSSTINLREEITYQFDSLYNEEYSNMKLKQTYLKSNNNADDQLLEDKINNSELNSCDNIKIKKVGKLQVEINRKVIDEDYRKNIYCQPRPVRNVDLFIKPRTPWTFPTSIWAFYEYKYEGDSDDLYDLLLENDFSRNFSNYREDPVLLEILKILKTSYKQIIDCYKVISAQMGSSIWQINQTSLFDFTNLCPGLFEPSYGFNELFIQVKTVAQILVDKEERKNKNKNLPNDNLVRHQFLNLMIKVANDKYISRKKKFNTLNEAVEYSLNTHFLPAMKLYDSNAFRIERYYNEYVDNFYKAHIPILDAVYKTFALNKDPGGKVVWIALDNFNELVSKIVDVDFFPLREVPIFFNLSLKLVVDELHSEKIYRMTFPEFLEALARVVDKASPIPPDDSTDDWSKEKRDGQTLVKKFENILQLLIKSISHPECKLVKEKFQLPIKEPGLGLYTWDQTNAFYQALKIR